MNGVTKLIIPLFYRFIVSFLKVTYGKENTKLNLFNVSLFRFSKLPMAKRIIYFCFDLNQKFNYSVSLFHHSKYFVISRITKLIFLFCYFIIITI
jgi:hypothetical protein